MIAKIQFGTRILLGLIYFVFGGMGLAMSMGLIHMPFPALPQAADGFMKGIMGTGYFFPFLKITETTCGFFLLAKISAPFALLVIAPVTLNILLFHAFLTPGLSELALPLVMVTAQILAMSAYWKIYKQLFGRK